MPHTYHESKRMTQPTIRQLTHDDIPAALELCRAAGWNQLREDWTRLIDYQPDGCFAAVVEGTLVGTVTTTSYGLQLAWIGMMLVRDDHRRHGIGTSLMRTSLDFLRSKRVACIKLDATPMGQMVYEQLGFQIEGSFQRWACPGRQPSAGHSRRDRLEQRHFALDRRAFGVDRAEWLERLAGDSQVLARDGGFAMLRRGAIADYLGPVVTESSSVAGDLVRDLLKCARGDQVFWDAMNPTAERLATSLGFQPVRDLTRMSIGDGMVEPDLNLQFAISDPGTG